MGRKVVVGVNDLTTTQPVVASEWHPTKNGDKKPEMYTDGSGYRAWWLCSICHKTEWQASIQSRCKTGNPGCRSCKAKIRGAELAKPAPGESFADKCPELLEEWDWELNDVSPYDLKPRSLYKAHWICKNDPEHKWQATLDNRTAGKGCRICSYADRGDKHSKPKPGQSIADLRPDLVAEWDWELNDLRPEDVSVGSAKPIHWVCSKDPSHKWVAPPCARKAGKGCDECAKKTRAEKRKKPKPGMSFGDKYPEMGKELDPELNDGKTAYDIRYSSALDYVWRCSKCGRTWVTSPNHRGQYGVDSPMCDGCKGEGYLVDTHPEIAEEWDTERNNELGLRLEDMRTYSSTKAYWIGKCGHSWFTSVADRSNGNGCFVCWQKRKVSFPEKAAYSYIPLENCFANAHPDIPGLGNMEFDIWLPDIKTAIEYDGGPWHKDIERDLRKDKICEDNGIRMIRIRDSQCPIYESSAEFIYRSDFKSSESLNEAIREMLRLLGLDDSDVDVDRDKEKIMQMVANHGEDE